MYSKLLKLTKFAMHYSVTKEYLLLQELNQAVSTRKYAVTAYLSNMQLNIQLTK